MTADVAPPLVFAEAVTLIGGGARDASALDDAVARAPRIVAADGGANGLAEVGVSLDAIIGDMDSVRDLPLWRDRGAAVLPIAEQDTTDLEKCLYATEAPAYLGVGFTGRRFDHTLAALHALLRWPEKRVVLIGEEDLVFLAPRLWRAKLAPGARVSFFPLRPCAGLRSTGLRWPLAGVKLEAGDRIGSSNEAVSANVAAEFDRVGVAAIVERRFLDAVLSSIGA